jgi:pimeloyl-ACP methyl ester carboxylesterase
MHYAGFKRALLSSMRSMVYVNNITEYETLGKRGYPVVLFWGREDQTIPIEDIQTLRGALPDHQFYPVDQAGHLPHFEKPEVVNLLLIELLTNVDR